MNCSRLLASEPIGADTSSFCFLAFYLHAEAQGFVLLWRFQQALRYALVWSHGSQQQDFWQLSGLGSFNHLDLTTQSKGPPWNS
jgi:hypothetical protein